ncbi:MAG: hypothetical protein KC646_01755 [Candidatus Cloacimonetes bacterium]|nr:hypothetical protein [Candidatus Cloacimonadota bacterium]
MDKKKIKTYLCLCAFALSLLLIGCGAKVDDSSSSVIASKLFVSGTLTFPTTVSSSISKSILKSISKSSSSNRVVSAKLSVYKADDFEFSNDLLKSSANVITNSQGQFILNEEDFETANPKNLGTLVLRFTFDDKEMFSLYDPNSFLVSVPKINVDVNSDGAYRFVKEEIFNRIGGGSNQSTVASIKAEINPMLDEVLALQLKYADSLVFNNVKASDFLITRDQRFAGRGKQWLEQSEKLDTSDSIVKGFVEVKSRVENKLIVQNNTSPVRKQAQLVLSLLDLGYFILLPNQRVLVADRWSKLDNGNTIPYKAYLNLDEILSSINQTLPDSEKSILKAPNKIISLSTSELDTIASISPNHKLIIDAIVKDARRFPWINLQILSELAKVSGSNFLNVTSLYQKSSINHEVHLADGEFVSNASGSLDYFFPYQAIKSVGFTKGVSASLQKRLSTRSALNFGLNTFFEFLSQDNIYLGYFLETLEAKHKKAIKNGFSPKLHLDSFSAPQSKLSIQNTMYRNFSGSLQYTSLAISRKAQYLQKYYEWNRDKSIQGQSLSNTTNLSVMDFFYESLLEGFMVFPSDSTQTLFTILGPNVIPNYLNITHLSKKLDSYVSYYQSILNDSNINVQLNIDTGFSLWETKLSSLRQTLDKTSFIDNFTESTIVAGRLLASDQSATPLENFKLLLFDSQQKLIQSTYSNGFGEYSFQSIQAPKDLMLAIELNSLSNSQSQIMTIQEEIFLHGWEKRKALHDYFLLNQVNSSTGETIVLTQIQKSNQSPFLALNTTKQISKSLLELSIAYSDFETADLNFLMNYTHDGNLYRAKSLKLLPTTTNTQNTISLSSTRNSSTVSIYWDIYNDLSSKISDLSTVNSIILSMALQESQDLRVGSSIVNKFQVLDFKVPSVRFIYPTTSSILSNTIVSSVDVEIKDKSGVAYANLVNLSKPSSNRVTVNGIQDLQNRDIWHFQNFELESGIANVFEIETMDFLSNKHAQNLTHVVNSLDATPPKIWFKEISLFKSQYKSKLKVFKTYSVDGANKLTIEIPVTPTILGNSVQYSLAQSWTRFENDVSSVYLELDAVTTSSLQYTLNITDENNISFYQIGTKKIFPPQSNNINVSERVSFLNEQQNYLLDISAFDSSSLQSQLSLKIRTLDFQGPSIFVSSPSISSLTTIYSTTQSIQGLSVDTSPIASVSACIGSQCVSISSTSTQLSWELTGLQFTEGLSNTVNISASDIFGNISKLSPFVYELDDVTKPSLVVTSVNGVSSSIIITTGQELSPPIYELTNCKDLLCPVNVKGFIEDRSGFNLSSNGLGLFDSFRLTIPESYSELINPPLSSTNSVTHFSRVTINNHLSQSALFHQTASIVKDGIWPVRLYLEDNYTGKYQGYTKAPLKSNAILYFKKDVTGPVISEFQLDTNSLTVGGKFKIRGKVGDELSAITNLNINGEASSFITSTSLSTWNNIVTLPTNSSIVFEKVLTAVSGANTVFLTASDSFGNISTSSLVFNIFPIFDSLKSTYKNVFTSPSDMDFTGVGLSSVLISQKSNPSLSLIGVGFQSILGVTGTTNSDYSTLKKLHNFASFTSMNPANTTQTVLLNGHFEGINSDVNRTIHLKKDLNNQSSTFLSYISEGEGKDNQSHQLYRDVAVVSGSFTNLSTATIFEYSPFLSSVTYAYSATSSNSSSQLFRYVNGVQTGINLPSSQGGKPSSTGLLGLLDFQLPSTISSIRVTQSYVVNSSNPNNLDIGSEVVHLLDSNNKKILRQHFDSKTSQSFQALTALTFTYSPVAFEVSINGDILYVADDKLKIHKYRRESTDALTLLTSFGGHGLRDGQFITISSIRALQRTSHQGIEEIWVVDEQSSRISSFTSNGVFISHYLQNPNNIGAQQNIVDMDFTPNDELFVVDQQLAAIDFYTKNLQSDYRINLESLGQGLLQTESHVGFTKWQEQNFTQAVTNKDNPLYFTNSFEKLKASTREVHVLVPSKKSLYSMRETSDSYFRSILTNGLRTLEFQTSRTYTFLTTSTGLELAFDKAVDMNVAYDIDNHLLTLENVNGAKSRLQYRKLDGSAIPDTHANLNLQSEAVDFCRFDKGIISIGSDPKNKLEVYLSRSNPSLNRLGFVSSESIIDFAGNSIGFTNPKAMSCNKDQVAIIDEEVIKIFSIVVNLDNTVQITQKANLDYYQDLGKVKSLSQPKQLAINDDYLFVVDGLNSLIKYRLR